MNGRLMRSGNSGLPRKHERKVFLTARRNGTGKAVGVPFRYGDMELEIDRDAFDFPVAVAGGILPAASAELPLPFSIRFGQLAASRLGFGQGALGRRGELFRF